MAQAITDNKYIMGVPQYRFEVTINGQVEYFDQGWKSAVKAYQAHKKNELVTCRDWDKKEETWVDTTDVTIEEGRLRAERSKAANGKEPTEPKEVVPTMSESQIGLVKGAVATLSLVAQVGKKQLPDHETKQLVGMELMNVLTAIGYTPEDIRNLAKQYVASQKGQVVAPELVH